MEARLRRADGEYRWFLIRAVPLRDELGNIVRWYGTNTDIEDRKQAEEIRAAQARQAGVRADVSAALSKPAHSGEILHGAAEAIVRHLDAAFARIWTLNTEKNMLELQASAGMYTHLDGPHSRIQVGDLKIGLIAEEKKPHLTNDVLDDPRVSDKAWAQSEGIVSFAGYPLMVKEHVVGVMAMFARQRLSAATLDILASVADSIAQGIERKWAEEVVREQAGLLDLTHDTVFVRAMDDVITYWNRGAAELYEWTREEAIGKVTHQLLQTIFPAPLEEINAELLRTGRWEGELVHTKRDGMKVTVGSRWSLQRDDHGRPAAILETNNDITEHKRAEEALRKAQGELAHVTRVMTVGELAASIAHEINQPLAAVVMNANACLRWLAGATPNLDEARDAIGRILRDGNRASDVISRIRALVSKTDTDKSRLDVNGAIQEVAALA
jgi:PAS domain S-box-containing protein